nr:MAG TPA: hypothetical protein [Caudoviricetes sp.]
MLYFKHEKKSLQLNTPTPSENTCIFIICSCKSFFQYLK